MKHYSMFTSHFVHTAGDEAMALIHVRQPMELQLELHVEGLNTMNLGNSVVCNFFIFALRKPRNVTTLPTATILKLR